MGYIKKEYREILEYLDSIGNNLPNKWDYFVKNKKVFHNLIIKSKEGKICTNCKHIFNSKKDVGEYDKCPNCKNTYLVKSKQLKNYYFANTLILLDKVKGKLLFRYFELYSHYDKSSNSFKSSVVEFGRTFFQNNVDVVNDRVSRCQCYVHVNHLENPGKWREYTRNYNFEKMGYTYPYNMKKVLKDTEYKYLDLKDFIMHTDIIDLEYIFKNVARTSMFEMLCKLKLYKLAIEAYNFTNKGSFYYIFGVPKDYYNFIKRNNLSYRELECLRILNKKDIKLIRYLNKYNTNALQDIINYISIDKFIKYAKKHKGKIDVHMYNDYLRFAHLLGLDLKNKKYIYPDNLKAKHDELEECFKIHNRQILNNNIAKRFEILKENIYKDDTYIILPAKSVEKLEQESKEQCNCVRTYSEKYASGECDIYFMRLKSKANKSLVTVEVKNNKIVQSRIKYNETPNKNHLSFLKKWENVVLNKVRA